MPTTYILYSTILDKYYIGSTEMAVKDRLQKHLSNHDGFTAKAKDWIVVYENMHQTVSEARKEEVRIKRAKSRTAIERLIKQKQ